MRPSRMPTSACLGGAPVPSTSVPPRISVSRVMILGSAPRSAPYGRRAVVSLRLPLRVVHRRTPLGLGARTRFLCAYRRGALGVLRGAALFALGLQLLL